ncbi:MAG: PEP-utilizing enzyme [Candidatus Diapherotrites archaeon]|nr:PEP-utilizing enzyme [Candidatus Diapherotrites archaeon]
MGQEKLVHFFDEPEAGTWVLRNFGKATTKFVKEFQPFCFKKIVYFYTGQDCILAVGEKDIVETGRKISGFFEQNPEKGLKIVKQMHKDAEQILREIKPLEKKDTAKFSNKELWQWFNKFDSLVLNQFASGANPLMCDVYEPWLTTKVEKIFLREFGEKAPEAFATIMTPLEESPIKTEETDFLKMLQAVQKNPGLLKAFKELPVEELKEKINSFPKEKKLFEMHLQKYSWIPHNFIGKAWDLGFFLQKTKDALQLNIHTKKLLEELVKHRKELIFSKKKFWKQLKVSKKEKQLIELLAGFLFTKVYRKDRLVQSGIFAKKLYQEIGKRLNLSLVQVRFMEPEEIYKVLITGKLPNLIELNLRTKSCVGVCENGKHEYFVGEKAEEFRKNFTIAEVKMVNELKGQCAFPGKAKGRVKLVNSAEDIAKFEQGDIMISIATLPEYLPAMKKSSAIVTNTGGITCHAAVVSRELKIPCLIGTKHATKIFKDGDLVEVDAGKGIVRKI